VHHGVQWHLRSAGAEVVAHGGEIFSLSLAGKGHPVAVAHGRIVRVIPGPGHGLLQRHHFHGGKLDGSFFDAFAIAEGTHIGVVGPGAAQGGGVAVSLTQPVIPHGLEFGAVGLHQIAPRNVVVEQAVFVLDLQHADRRVQAVGDARVGVDMVKEKVVGVLLLQLDEAFVEEGVGAPRAVHLVGVGQAVAIAESAVAAQHEIDIHAALLCLRHPVVHAIAVLGVELRAAVVVGVRFVDDVASHKVVFLTAAVVHLVQAHHVAAAPGHYIEHRGDARFFNLPHVIRRHGHAPEAQPLAVFLGAEVAVWALLNPTVLARGGIQQIGEVHQG